MQAIDASRLQNFETIVPVGSLNVTAYPVEPYDVSNKLYVDEQVETVKYLAGNGLVLDVDNRFSIDAQLPMVTQLGTLTSLQVSGDSSLQQVSLNGNRLTNVALPSLPTDGASKAYVDDAYIAGTGLTKTGVTFATAPAQPNITSVGTLTSLTVIGTTRVPIPLSEGEAANKSYVDSVYIAGTGLSKTGTTFNVTPIQSQITTVGTLTGLTVAGPAFFQGGADLQGWSIINLSDPIDPTDAANKAYTDRAYTAGNGLSVSGGVFSVNASQPGITSVGTLTSLDVSGRITTGATATAATDVANKTYVDGAYDAGTGLVKTGTTFSVGPTQSLTTLSVTGATVVRTPQGPTEAANKSYVDSHYTAGIGLALSAAGVFSVATTLPTLDNLNVTGAVTMQSGADMNGAGIINLSDPLDPTDAATKSYVDGAYTAGTGIAVVNRVISIAANASIPNLVITGKLTVPTPTLGTDAASKTYVDGAYKAGTGISLSNGFFSAASNQPQITTVGTLTSLNVSGTVTLQSGADLNGASIINVGDPIDPGDAVNKSYADTAFRAGTGLTLTNGTFAVNTALPNVTSVGTLTGLTVTGSTNFPVPTVPSNVATKGYVDGYYAAGTGLNLTSGTFSVLPAQPQITSVGTLSNLIVSGKVTLNTAPTVATDATNKQYVDNAYIAGTGLTKIGTSFSVNADQTQIVALGTLNDLIVAGGATFQSGADFNGASVINLGPPFDPSDAATKEYVDTTKGELTDVTVTGITNLPFQIAEPASGDTVTIGNAPGVCIIAGGTLATLTINMPSAPSDGRVVVITSVVNVTAVTFTNATFGTGTPTTITAGVPLRYVYIDYSGFWVTI